jgi:hypothetical protein
MKIGEEMKLAELEHERNAILKELSIARWLAGLSVADQIIFREAIALALVRGSNFAMSKRADELQRALEAQRTTQQPPPPAV